MNKFIFFISLGLLCLFSSPLEARASFSRDPQWRAVVTSLQGSGIAKVRRKTGVETVAGVRMEIYEGDKIVTDKSTAMELLLLDGSLIQLAKGSEFKIDSTSVQKKSWSWSVQLVSGGLRALTEKSLIEQATLKVLHEGSMIEAMGGSDFVFGAPTQEKPAFVYVLAGTIFDCAAGAGEKKHCAKKTKEDAVVADANTFEQLRSLGLINIKRASVATKEELNESLGRVRSEAIEDQDFLIGRSSEVREAVHAAMSEGTYDEIILYANKFAEVLTKHIRKETEQPENVTLAARKVAFVSSLQSAATLQPAKWKFLKRPTAGSVVNVPAVTVEKAKVQRKEVAKDRARLNDASIKYLMMNSSLAAELGSELTSVASIEEECGSNIICSREKIFNLVLASGHIAETAFPRSAEKYAGVFEHMKRTEQHRSSLIPSLRTRPEK